MCVRVDFVYHLFDLSWDRVRRVCLRSGSSVVFIDGGGVYYLLFLTMVVCIIVRLIFMSCFVMVSVVVRICVVECGSFRESWSG